MDKIKILVADDITETRNVIKKILNLENQYFEIVGEAVNGEDVLRLIPKVKPDVVLMDINMPLLNGLEATERISNEFPWVIVIIMSVQGENEYLKKAMLYGAKEYIIKPFNYDALIDTIKVTYEKNKERLVKQVYSEEPAHNATFAAFFSSKGGVGKSVLALNMAISISRLGNAKVLFMDLDLLFGDISMMVNQYTQRTILDVIEDGQLDSYENIRPYLYEHNKNLHMLFAPRKPEAAEYITKESIEMLIKAFEKNYDLIVIDTGINFNDNTLYALDRADTIFYVSSMDIVSLKNTKLGLGVMQSLGYDNNKVKLVINKFTTSYGIGKSDVEAAFKDNKLIVIPEDEKTVNISINKGMPFCDENKYEKLKIGKAVADMIKYI